MSYLGDFPEDSTVVFSWDTFDSDGASVTRATDGTVSVYKDGGATQSTAGVTDTEDFDSLVGIHICSIDTSADAFYAAGSDYTVILSASTIDGQTVNATIGSFSIENRTAYPKADMPSNFSLLGIESDGDLTKVNTLNGHTAQTGDSFAALPTNFVSLAISAGGIVNSNLEEISGSAVVESSSGRIAGNFNTIYNNADAATLKTADDIGSATVSGTVSANVVSFLGTAVSESTAGNIAANFDSIFDNGDSITSKTADDIGSATVSGTIEADVISIHGTALSETTSGRLAANFVTFFENADSATSQTLDHVGSGAGTVNANVVSILSGALTQNTAGRLAHNFSTFYDNADADTTNVVDNVGNSSGTFDANLVQIHGTAINETTSGRLAANWETFFENGDAVSAATVGLVSTINSTIGGVAGSGAYTITVNVQDTEISPADLQNVTVRMVEGANNYVAITDVNGDAVFSLDAATYTVTVAKAGYSPTVGNAATIVVSGTGSSALTMDLMNITYPSDATESTGIMVCYDAENNAEQNVVVNVQLTAGTGTDGFARDTQPRIVSSDVDGQVSFPGLVRGATYSCWRGGYSQTSNFGSTKVSGSKVSFVVPEAASFSLPEILGRE